MVPIPADWKRQGWSFMFMPSRDLLLRLLLPSSLAPSPPPPFPLLLLLLLFLLLLPPNLLLCFLLLFCFKWNLHPLPAVVESLPGIWMLPVPPLTSVNQEDMIFRFFPDVTLPLMPFDFLWEGDRDMEEGLGQFEGVGRWREMGGAGLRIETRKLLGRRLGWREGETDIPGPWPRTNHLCIRQNSSRTVAPCNR